MKIDVRVMWDSERDAQEASRLVQRIVAALREAGYSVRVKGPIPNRRNSGGRVYIRVYRRGRF